jgi:GH24 family phage-related lysozyme (muramidase)
MGMLEELIVQLRPSEGWSPVAYLDTKGYLTIAHGFNLGKPYIENGRIRFKPVGRVSNAIGEQLLLAKVLEAVEYMRRRYPWIDSLDEIRQRVLFDMGYNMGPAFLDNWPIFVGQLRRGAWGAAADNMLSTKWAVDVGKEGPSPRFPGGQRAWRHARMMRTGKDLKPLATTVEVGGDE